MDTEFKDNGNDGGAGQPYSPVGRPAGNQEYRSESGYYDYGGAGENSRRGDEFSYQKRPRGVAPYSRGFPVPAFQNDNIDESGALANQVLQRLHALAQGDQNSYGQQQLRSSFDAARAGASAFGVTARGRSAGAAMRGVSQQQQDLSLQQAGASQEMMIQEQAKAQQLLAQLYAAQHTQDIDLQTALAEQGIRGATMDDAMAQFYSGSDVQAYIDNLNRSYATYRNQAGLGAGSMANGQELMRAGSGAIGTMLGSGGSMGSGSGTKPWDSTISSV